MSRRIRRRICEDKRNGLSRSDREVSDRRELLSANFDRRSQDKHVRSGNCQERSGVSPPYPRDGGAVIEADDQLGRHRYGAAFADDKTNEMRGLAAQRHEVDQRGLAVGSDKSRFQNQRIRPVAARNARLVLCRRDPPASILAGPEKGGKACIGVETGPAEPIDRAALRHQRSRLEIADQPVILDAPAHEHQLFNECMTEKGGAAALFTPASRWPP